MRQLDVSSILKVFDPLCNAKLMTHLIWQYWRVVVERRGGGGIKLMSICHMRT